MSFRDYQDCTAKCITCNGSEELEKEVNKIQKKYTIIDLQYSTHVIGNEIMQVERHSVFLLVSPKRSKK